jgi:hypothetical protein
MVYQFGEVDDNFTTVSGKEIVMVRHAGSILNKKSPTRGRVPEYHHIDKFAFLFFSFGSPQCTFIWV